MKWCSDSKLPFTWDMNFLNMGTICLLNKFFGQATLQYIDLLWNPCSASWTQRTDFRLHSRVDRLMMEFISAPDTQGSNLTPSSHIRHQIMFSKPISGIKLLLHPCVIWKILGIPLKRSQVLCGQETKFHRFSSTWSWPLKTWFSVILLVESKEPIFSLYMEIWYKIS